MKKYFLLTIMLFIVARLSAQQQFDFTPSVTQGCTPLLVTFTNTTDPAIIADYRYEWVVEPGKFSTEIYQVENSYLKPGVYTAQMKVFDKKTNMLLETVSKTIQAFNDPDVQITSDKTESCVYKPFQFSITEKTSDSPIVSYMWIVSDGATYPMEAPYAHYFTYAGTHNVFCAVTDANGCTNRERHTISVKTYNDAPQTNFTVDKDRTCDPSLQVQFTNTSPADPNLAGFEWNFGDGSPVNSTTKSPSHRYNGYGTYYATLKNTSIHDCEAFASIAIQLIDYQPDFTISDAGKAIDGNKACHGTITFEGNATPAYPQTISYSWDYENGSSKGSGQTFSLTENTGGMKRMKLTVSNGVCEKTVTKTFEIETPLQISYTSTDEFYCKPTDVLYSATSNVPNSTFEWIINGDTIQGQTTRYYFADEGIYSDALTVTTPNGCTESISKPNNIELVFPVIDLSILTAESGCAPLDVTFGEVTTYNTERDEIVKVEWDFDYKNNTFTTDVTAFDQASWTYNTRGVYQTAVRATTKKGCVVYDFATDNPLTGEKEIVKVGNKPSADLIFPDTVMCASDDLKFLYKNGDDVNSPMNHFYDTLFVRYPHYEFPEDNPYGEPNSMFTAPKMRPELQSQLRDTIGPHYVFYMLSDHGCRSEEMQDYVEELNIPTTIHVHGPIIEMVSSGKDCINNYDYTYALSKKINVDYSSPNQYVNWYLQKFDRRGRLTPRWHIAHNEDTVYIDFKDTVHTHFGEPDGRGTYLITVVAYNGDEECYSDGTKCECSDSVSYLTTITELRIDFTISNPTPCLNGEAFIQLGANAQDVDRYETYWVKNKGAFNEERRQIDTAFYFDNKNIRYVEVETGDRYYPECRGSMRVPVKVYKPEAGFIATITSDCLPFTTVFSDTTRWDTDTTIVKREWYFGNGTPWQGSDSVHTVLYEYESFVSPSLTVYDILGCYDTRTKQDYIKPIVPNSKFIVTTPQLCLNHNAIITRDLNNPYYDNNIHKFTWDFGDGTIVQGDNIVNAEYIKSDTVRHRYTQESVPGVFNISLTAYSKSPIDPNRECEATTAATIEVKDASAQIMIRDMDKCKEPGQVFIVYIDNNWYSGKYNSAEWFKIDNNKRTLVSNASTPRAITFLNYGMQSIELITRSDYYGCELDTKTAEIFVPGYEVEFEANKYLVCVGEDVTFTRTRAVSVDNYTSYWSFGDGVLNFTDLKQAVHAYSTLPDTENKRFRVQYIVDAPNCKPQDIFRLIELHPVEANFLRGIDDLDEVGCAPHTVNFINTSVGVKNNTYKWNFGDGTTSTEKNPIHTFVSRDEPYEVSLAIEGVACNDERTKKIYFYPKPYVQFDYDSLLCVGESTTIKAQGDFSTIAWKPAQYFSDPNSAITLYTPRQTGRAYAEIISQYGCVEHDSLYVFVQQRPRYQGAPDSALLYYRTPTQLMLTARPDSKLIAGQIYNVNNTPMEGVFYEWSPSDYLSCTHCISPNIHLECGTPGYPSCLDFPLEVQYRIYMYDTLGCFEENAYIQFQIVIETKAALPQAFTPNGDGNNDIAFVRGWGIKEFLEVKIYNRWGQLLFESNDLNHGWNGRYNGEDQPMETYSYTIRYIDSKDKEQFVKGYITLIR
ncbi:MAG: PKD domain-containing protein [Bacteroidetes bacterium]|nr:PKD domain-containing protein [Bacteroidota bacterium]